MPSPQRLAIPAHRQLRVADITRTDIGFIAELIEAHPQACRQELSRLLCQAWGWRQDNGHLRDMVCRGLLLKLHRAGEIVLPPARSRSPGLAALTQPEPVLLDTAPIEATLGGLGTLELAQVRRTASGLAAGIRAMGEPRPADWGGPTMWNVAVFVVGAG